MKKKLTKTEKLMIEGYKSMGKEDLELSDQFFKLASETILKTPTYTLPTKEK